MQLIVKEYHNRFSTVLFTWDAPNDASRINYYQYQLANETTVITYNTTNTSVAVSRIPYNKNITFSLVAVNCVGSSDEIREVVNVGKCTLPIGALLYDYRKVNSDNIIIIIKHHYN